MKIVFMGTPAYSVPCLRELTRTEEVCAVFSQPDKPKGRGNVLFYTPVKEYALTHGIPVFQPVSMRKGEGLDSVLEILQSFEPELIVVTAYGQILPEEIIKFPKYGCINMHASLLPKLRGAAPIERCILAGETETGVTSMQMDKGLDTGDILLSRHILVGADETAAELKIRLSELSAAVMCETIEDLKSGNLEPQIQDDALSSYAPMIKKEMSALDFALTALEIHRTIRAVTGYCFLEGKRLKIFKTLLTDRKSDTPGLLFSDDGRLFIGASDKCLEITLLQLEGKKRQTAEEFINGHNKDTVVENGK
jgi:methionyl-tRNA formyltransferase